MIIGPYTTERVISEGGFGTIYQATHGLLETSACIKVNKNVTELDEEIIMMEARLLWNLDDYHSIPSAKDLIPLERRRYALVMDYIDGDPLDKLVERKGPIHAEDASWILERLLGALNYLHYHQVIHCDIKPQNVIVEPKKRDIKLIDFGLSSYLPDHLTKPIGYTPAFAAPELRDGKPPLPESDLYGAGMTLLYMLTGSPHVTTLPKSVPQPLARFCEELIRYDPLQRPSWEKEDLLGRISDIRQEAFGRRHSR
jgi:serine/threonine protein kinase